MKKLNFCLVWLIALTLTAALAVSATAAPASVVTKETVKGWMDKGDVMILDARQGRDWTSSEFKIKGAYRTEPSKFDNWKSNFAKDKTIVLYCA